MHEALDLSGKGELMAFSNNKTCWSELQGLDGIRPCGSAPYNSMYKGYFIYCATVTELDPCQPPAGCCPELEPWMAYVGMGSEELGIIFEDDESLESNYFADGDDWVGRVAGYLFHEHYAIDVRTAWAQEHFSEHCRIRNYQEAPDPFKDLCDSLCLDQLQHADGEVVRSMMKMAYELNPQPTK